MNFTTGPYGVKSAIDNKKDIVIVDVRAEKDYAQGDIFQELSIYQPLMELKPNLRGFEKIHLIMFICYTLLCNASQKACKKFTSLGYPVKEIRGGFKSWKEHNILLKSKIF